MTTHTDLDVLLVGHVTRDRLCINGHTETGTGGGVYYGSIPLRCLGLETGVVTRLHPNDAGLLNEMKRQGVKVFARPALETSQIENIYSSADQEERTCRMTEFAGAFETGDLPTQSSCVTLASPLVADEISSSLLHTLAERGPLAMDVQGFMRVRKNSDLVLRDWAEKGTGFPLATYLKMDRAEARVLTGLSDPAQAIQAIAAFGPREIMLTYDGMVLLYVDRQVYSARFAPRVRNGRTGRGDTCFATYIGCRRNMEPIQALHFAAALTSIKLEQAGPFHGTLAEVQARVPETFLAA